MARSLLTTTWFTDYWADYEPIAEANLREALELAERVGDSDLMLDARAATMHRTGLSGFDRQASEALLADLEERRDPVKLNAHCFWMMWQYQFLGAFEASVEMCDRGLELADLIGSAPVQYGSIKAISLVELGRFDEVEAAIAQEVTDDEHPFGQAMASLARSVYLTRVAAWDAALASLADTIERATALSRVWMHRWATSMQAVAAAHLRAEVGEPVDDVSGTAPRIRALDRGEIALVEGRPEEAVDLATTIIDRSGAPVSADLVRGLDLLARAHLERGDHDGAAEVAERGIELADTMQFDALGWRLRTVRALATGASSDDAADRFHTLAGRIANPTLRSAFEHQPLAPT